MMAVMRPRCRLRRSFQRDLSESVNGAFSHARCGKALGVGDSVGSGKSAACSTTHSAELVLRPHANYGLPPRCAAAVVVAALVAAVAAAAAVPDAADLCVRFARQAGLEDMMGTELVSAMLPQPPADNICLWYSL